MTAVVVGLVSHFVSGQAGPAAIVIGNGLALSSTAVVLQVIVTNGFCFKLLDIITYYTLNPPILSKEKK